MPEDLKQETKVTEQKTDIAPKKDKKFVFLNLPKYSVGIRTTFIVSTFGFITLLALLTICFLYFNYSTTFIYEEGKLVKEIVCFNFSPHVKCLCIFIVLVILSVYIFFTIFLFKKFKNRYEIIDDLDVKFVTAYLKK